MKPEASIVNAEGALMRPHYPNAPLAPQEQSPVSSPAQVALIALPAPKHTAGLSVARPLNGETACAGNEVKRPNAVGRPAPRAATSVKVGVVE